MGNRSIGQCFLNRIRDLITCARTEWMVTFLTIVLSTGVFAATDETGKPVHIVSHGLHAGILIPNPGRTSATSIWSNLFPGSPWLEMGWGDGKFYPEPDAGFLLGMRALMVPTASVLHVVEVPDSGPDYFGEDNTLEVRLSDAQFARLVASIESAFVRDAGGMPIPLGPGRYGRSQFFDAHGDFHLFRNCNHWVIERLEDAGLHVEATGALTGDGLLKMLREQLADDKGDSPSDTSIKH